jgi:hypothetical protein
MPLLGKVAARISIWHTSFINGLVAVIDTYVVEQGTMIIKNYWLLAASSLPSDYLPFDQESLPGPLEFIRRLRPGEGIVLGSWNDQEQIGRISALGVCVDTKRVDWREVDFALKPNPAGRTHWRSKPFFCFAASVVERYGLADLFAERFPDLDEYTFASPSPRTGITRRLPSIATPGYVYLIKSPYGFKIGKTVNMKSRTRLFEVKLPFRIKVEHFAWFEDYSEAERSQHDKFRSKRLEGEWFDLDDVDIAYIRTLGRAATPHEIQGL